MTTSDWDAEYKAKYEQRLADMAQVDYEKYVAMEQRRTLPTEQQCRWAADDTARANQFLADHERTQKCIWRALAILAATCFVLAAVAVIYFGDVPVGRFVANLFSR